LRARLRQLDDDIIAAAAARETAVRQRLEQPELPGSASVTAAAAHECLVAAEQALAGIHHRHGAGRHARDQDDALRARRQAALLAAGTVLEQARQARALYDLIGHKDGEVFRRFAQALTLDRLLVLANGRLAVLQPRYNLARTPTAIGSGVSLELEVIDNDQAEERRPVATLSGGESFLVSLALSLALADLQGGGLRLGTLFIDEGFGSLDPATLDRCLAILERLQQDQGTQIVVISHIGALHERLAHRIEVLPCGHGRSRIRVVWPGGLSETPTVQDAAPLPTRRRVRRTLMP
jgi:exonuclease SbcC